MTDNPYTPQEGDVAIRLVAPSHGLPVEYLVNRYTGGFWQSGVRMDPSFAQAASAALVCVIPLDTGDSIPGVYRRQV